MFVVNPYPAANDAMPVSIVLMLSVAEVYVIGYSTPAESIILILKVAPLAETTVVGTFEPSLTPAPVRIILMSVEFP